MVKINQRGKRQERLLGIDRDWLHNKHVAAAEAPSLFSFSFRRDVTTARRPMRDVIEARATAAAAAAAAGSAAAFAFQIVTKDEGGIVTIDYEAGSEADRQDILDTINYLAALPA